jgi:Spy/CpxP family protein refolding chaperone
MHIKSLRRNDVKMPLIHKAKDLTHMNSKENLDQGLTINAFLTASRKYLSLSKQSTFVSVVTSKLQRTRMNSYRKAVQSFLLVAGVSAFVAGPVMADPVCGHMGGHTERHARMMEQHHTQLHEALKLSAEQEPAWKKLMESEQSGPAMGGGPAEDWAKLNTPERAEKMLELSKARQVQMAEHVSALKAFYAVLTPEQQKTFEDFHSGHRGHMAGKPGAKPARTDKAPSKP